MASSATAFCGIVTMLAARPPTRVIAAHHSTEVAAAIRSDTVEVVATVAMVVTGHPEAAPNRPYTATPTAAAATTDAAMEAYAVARRRRARACHAA
jgi:hypothetical protein